MKKYVLLLSAHWIDNFLIEKYFRLKQAFADYGDTFILLNWENEQMPFFENKDIAYLSFSVEDLNGLEYNPLCETLVPGSSHFALLWFYRLHPHYEYYWNIESDVEFTGNWRLLFDAFYNKKADFIASHIEYFNENPNWYWWNSYQGTTLHVPLQKRIRSFNPIYRISGQALCFMHSFQKSGNCGHYELLLPTALLYSGFSLLDFGGKGQFTLRGYEERFYYVDACPEAPFHLGTMRHKPNFKYDALLNIQNKLFHPVKRESDEFYDIL